MTNTRLSGRVKTARPSVHGSTPLEQASEPHNTAAEAASSQATGGCSLGNYLIKISHRKSSGLNFGRLSKNENPFEF